MAPVVVAARPLWGLPLPRGVGRLVTWSFDVDGRAVMYIWRASSGNVHDMIWNEFRKRF